MSLMENAKIESEAHIRAVCRGMVSSLTGRGSVGGRWIEGGKRCDRYWMGSWRWVCVS